MEQATSIWTHPETVMMVETLRRITILLLVIAIVWKLVVMQRYTREWDSLGRAMRFENVAWMVVWTWAFFRLVFPSIDHPGIILVLIVLLIYATARVVIALPRSKVFRVEPKDARDLRQDATERRQDARETEQDLRDERWEAQ